MQHQNTAESVIALYCHPDTDLMSLAKLSGGNIELKADADVGSAVISGLGLAVRRISRFRRCLDDSGVTYQVHGDGIRIPASEAGGAFLQVEEGL
jgi:hypothetical protein